MIQEEGWQILQHEYWSNEIFYSLVKRTPDTLYYLNFYKILHDSIFNPGEDICTISSYRKIFRDGIFEYVLNMITDTNYFYKYPINNPDSLIFIVGKYCYLFNKGNLSNKQKSFYFENRDSLKKIQGNNLPDLPELSNTK